MNAATEEYKYKIRVHYGVGFRQKSDQIKIVGLSTSLDYAVEHAKLITKLSNVFNFEELMIIDPFGIITLDVCDDNDNIYFNKILVEV